MHDVHELTQEAVEFVRRNLSGVGRVAVPFSGGKDSVCAAHIMRLSGVPHRLIYNFTALDPPPMPGFIRRHYPDCDFIPVRKSFWQMIPNQNPPGVGSRWCCRDFKKRPSRGLPERHRVLGIRADESPAMRGKLPRINFIEKYGQVLYYPLFRWKWADVWDHIRYYDLPYPQLYDQGFDRIGCVVCHFHSGPDGGIHWLYRDRWPNHFRCFERWVGRWYDKRVGQGRTMYHDSTEAFLEDWYNGRFRYYNERPGTGSGKGKRHHYAAGGTAEIGGGTRQAPATYPGGKSGAGVFQRLINRIPPHEVFISAFLGGCGIMKNKQPARLNIGVEIDPVAAGSWPAEVPDLQIHVRDALDFLDTYPWTGREFVYCDPPYLPRTLRSRRRRYRFEFSEPQHVRLLKLLNRIGRPIRMLDLFCGAGGAAAGYHRAGITDITGVDIVPQPRYPFRFVESDALDYLRDHGHEYDVIHASPPCQCYSIASKLHRDNGKIYPDLISPVRELLNQIGKPWIIENVPGSPLHNPIVLCGLKFGLKVFRHRCFETSTPIPQPDHVSHAGKKVGEGYYSIAGGSGRWKSWGTVKRDVSKGTVKEWRDAMGIDWMIRKELTQAIPPAYTEYIGRHIVENWFSPRPNIMLSGYASDLYSRELNGWRAESFRARTRGGTATEWIWMNYPAPTELHDHRFVGSDYRDRERLAKKKARWEKCRTWPEREQAALAALLEGRTFDYSSLGENYRARETAARRVRRWAARIERQPEIERRALLASLSVADV